MKNLFIFFERNPWLLFVIMSVFAAVFYVFNIGSGDMWSDEVYTKSMLTGRLPDMYDKFRNDLHPPLYYLGLRMFTTVFGLNVIVLRLFSVLGVLATLTLGYFAGRRIFGKPGALIYCLMMLSLPMLAFHSHEGRMYTWAVFSVTGVFIYSCLFMRSANNRYLVLLFVFTLMAMYTHYYSMIAAFMANGFVFLYMLLTKNKKWIAHLSSVLLAALLYLPWLPMFLVQINRVQHAFWAPDVNFNTVIACLFAPFNEQYRITGFAIAFAVFMYCLLICAIIRSFTKSFSEYRVPLWLSLWIFFGTLMAIAVISLFSRPVLYFRYVTTLVTLLVVPQTILLISTRSKTLKLVLTAMILFLGIKVSLSAFRFSYGPYKKTVEYIAKTYPDIRKVLHITEITAGPMVEYNGNTGLGHYWLKAEMSNVDAFTEIHQYNEPGEFLHNGELFCTVKFAPLNLNKENLDRVLAESDLIRTDTLTDDKAENGIKILVYVLRYKGQ
jgi:uncharacterized membrane protein